MGINVEISSVFRKYLDNQQTVTVEGANVGECLRDLSRRYPQTEGMFLDKEGKLQSNFEIFINGETVYPLDTSTPLQDQDKLDLVYIIHGG